MSVNITIALDAMGGDHGAESVIPGAALSLKQNPDLKFLIFGDEGAIRAQIDGHADLLAASQIIHTEKKIEGGDKPSSALRASKGTSMRMAIEAVHDGEAQAVVSAGNTGALMALAKIVLKALPDIHRPAIASVFPGMHGRTIMLDLGANVLVDAENLAQFAVLGCAFARAYKGVEKPTFGLLNVGSEEMKGPDHVRAAAEILSNVDIAGRYTGFVEGDDIMKGAVDVIVCDGYAGNIALKTAEGVAKFAGENMKSAFKADPLAMLGALFASLALKRLKAKVDPRLYNGGVFLGLNGLCVKSHGGCDALAFSSAVNLAASLARDDYVARVGSEINDLISQETLMV